MVALIASAGLNMLLQLAFGGRMPASPADIHLAGTGLFIAAFIVLRKLKWSPVLVMALCGAAGLCLGLLGLA